MIPVHFSARSGAVSKVFEGEGQWCLFIVIEDGVDNSLEVVINHCILNGTGMQSYLLCTSQVEVLQCSHFMYICQVHIAAGQLSLSSLP